jgi:ectoine hydroxylase-related dioxygenase (phytanoyl-CoA dioxygenase family)
MIATSAQIASPSATSGPASGQQLAAQMRDQGFAVLPDLLTADQVAACNRRFSEFTALTGADDSQPEGSGLHSVAIPGVPGASLQYEPGFSPRGKSAAERELGVRKFFQFAQGDQFFWDLLRSPRILTTITAVIGAAPQLLQSLALVKPPEIGIPKDWHQDTPYFPITPVTETVGIWIALDRATLDNGCMQVVPGSHRNGPVPHVQGPTGWKLDATASAQAHAAAVALPMAAGSALLFDANLLHFTDANRSTQRRRAVQFHCSSACTTASGSLRLEPLALTRAPWAVSAG